MIDSQVRPHYDPAGHLQEKKERQKVPLFFTAAGKEEESIQFFRTCDFVKARNGGPAMRLCSSW